MHIQEESILMNDEPCFVLHTEPDVLARKSKSLQKDMPLYPETFFWLWADQSLLLLLKAVLIGEAENTDFSVLAWQGNQKLHLLFDFSATFLAHLA